MGLLYFSTPVSLSYTQLKGARCATELLACFDVKRKLPRFPPLMYPLPAMVPSSWMDPWPITHLKKEARATRKSSKAFSIYMESIGDWKKPIIKMLVPKSKICYRRIHHMVLTKATMINAWGSLRPQCSTPEGRRVQGATNWFALLNMVNSMKNKRGPSKRLLWYVSDP